MLWEILYEQIQTSSRLESTNQQLIAFKFEFEIFSIGFWFHFCWPNVKRSSIKVMITQMD